MKLGARILIIDDNDDFRKLMKEVLEAKGFAVFEAEDGKQALEMMSRMAFTMAIVDLNMPRMNGIEFSRRVKKDNPKFPIIMLSGTSQFYAPEEILASGVDAFLQKPLDLDKLTEAVDLL